MIDAKYFKEYREKLGFTNQNGIKAFFGAKDIVSEVDYKYLESLNGRLIQIVQKINLLVADEIKVDNFDLFCHENITTVFEKLKYNNIIVKLNNQGRRPEEVYFSWMRGFVISSYFLKALSQIFDVDIENIDLIGDDDFSNIETFKRTPKADLQINLQNGEKIRIEVQSGFQGINDIKQHKVIEAKKIKRDENIASLVIHFDLFNGQVAFVKIDEIDEDNVNWITRQQMEGQTVFNIDQNYFAWKLTEEPPKFISMSFE
ncbi:MAG: restriction endonuclease [Sulfurospirillaceae bacterium]|nr:restriction endonuclease [Sulfurospirillaceae bacterium]